MESGSMSRLALGFKEQRMGFQSMPPLIKHIQIVIA